MNKIDAIRDKWRTGLEEVHNSKWFKRLLAGELNKSHYIGYLRQSFYHAGENPQIQAAATILLGREQRAVNKKFYQHAISEIGHDELALSDMKALGVDTDLVRTGQPIAQTEALIAYGYHTALHKGPLDYLGYLFHLEFMPTQGGEQYMEGLRKIGIPDAAMTFVHEHSTVDIQHNKMMEGYVEKLVHTQSECDTIARSALITCELHAAMIFAAFESEDEHPAGT